MKIICQPLGFFSIIFKPYKSQEDTFILGLKFAYWIYTTVRLQNNLKKYFGFKFLYDCPGSLVDSVIDY